MTKKNGDVFEETFKVNNNELAGLFQKALDPESVNTFQKYMA